MADGQMDERRKGVHSGIKVEASRVVSVLFKKMETTTTTKTKNGGVHATDGWMYAEQAAPLTSLELIG